MRKDKVVKTRLKIKTEGCTYLQTYVQGQVKIGLFYKTIVSIEVGYSRDITECKRIVTEHLRKFVEAGFNSEGVIDL